MSESEFKSGAKRSEKHPNTNRVPLGFIQLVASRGDFGEAKYGRGNYTKGFDDPEFMEQFFAHAIAHLQALANYYHLHGKFPVQEDDDLAGASWGCMALWEAREYERRNREVSRDGSDTNRTA